MAFRFRQFDIEDECSTMRVGTDAMILGSWAQPPADSRILDVGTGCGVLALMMAQKSTACVDAIDIDLPSVEEARVNFKRSPWSDRLVVFHRSLQEHALECPGKYGFIIANPPYFSKSLRSPSARKNSARHEVNLEGAVLADAVARLLAPGGIFAVILPSSRAGVFTTSCVENGLHLRCGSAVISKPGASPLRQLMEFTDIQIVTPTIPSLCLRDENGQFSREYLALTANFHYF